MTAIRPRGWRWAPVRVRPDEAYAPPRAVPDPITEPAKPSSRAVAGCIGAGALVLLWCALAWAFIFALVAKYLP